MSDEHKKVDEWANSAWLVLVSRVMTIMVVPYLTWMGGAILDLKDKTTELNSAVLLAIEPRVGSLESELKELRSELSQRTTSRFTKEDAAEFKADMLRNIKRLDEQLENLKRAVN